MTDQCGDVPADTLARINADVAARRYTGVAGLRRVARRAAATASPASADPDEAAPTAGPYAGFPRYPNLLDAAQKPFRPPGSDVPWYISRGNHDGLVAGQRRPPARTCSAAIATGCLKVFPNAEFDPSRFAGQSADELFAAFGDPASSSRCWPAARPSRRTRTAGSSTRPSTAR